MPHFDNTITFGTILAIAAIVGSAWRLSYYVGTRLLSLELTVKQHGKDLNGFVSRLGAHEDRERSLVEKVQTLIGEHQRDA